MLRVRNTLHVEKFQASDALWRDIDGRPGIARLDTDAAAAFDEAGALLPL